MLENMNGIRYFREFLHRNRASELLLFWMEIEIYREYYNEKWNDSTVLKKLKCAQIYGQALRIFDRFIRDDAPCKIDERVIDHQCGSHIASILGMDDKYNVLSSSQSQIRMQKLNKSQTKQLKDVIESKVKSSSGLHSFPVSRLHELQGIFDDAQNKCYLKLKWSYFPRFLADKLCDGLLTTLKIEERFFDALKRSNMI